MFSDCSYNSTPKNYQSQYALIVEIKMHGIMEKHAWYDYIIARVNRSPSRFTYVYTLYTKISIY